MIARTTRAESKIMHGQYLVCSELGVYLLMLGRSGGHAGGKQGFSCPMSWQEGPGVTIPVKPGASLITEQSAYCSLTKC